MNWVILSAFLGAFVGSVVVHYVALHEYVIRKRIKFRKNKLFFIENEVNPDDKAVIISLGMSRYVMLYKALLIGTDFNKSERGFMHPYESATVIKKIKKEDIPLLMTDMSPTKFFDEYMKEA